MEAYKTYQKTVTVNGVNTKCTFAMNNDYVRTLETPERIEGTRSITVNNKVYQIKHVTTVNLTKANSVRLIFNGVNFPDNYRKIAEYILNNNL